MTRSHSFIRSKHLRFALIASFCVLPFAAISQTTSSVVDIIKPDPPKPDAPKQDTPKPDAASTSAKPAGPTDPKARKTYEDAFTWEKRRAYHEALEQFRKANKQDGGQCWECLRRAYSLSVKVESFKDAVDIARDMIPITQSDKQKAQAHLLLGMALQSEATKEKGEKKQPPLIESSSEFKTALELDPRLTRARFHWGITLAQLHQDDAARAQFTQFLDEDNSNPTLHDRAERFVDRIELARAAMAPPFSATTLDGREISMDGLAGKVVLIDFWATWCGPCREALPNIQRIAHKFEGQPFVVVSISLDNDEQAWKTFVARNNMTWNQVRDGGFNGKVSTRFGVTAIPATFSIDADGVLEDQHVGDANIEGKLKKMIARAVERRNAKPAPPAAPDASGSGN